LLDINKISEKLILKDGIWYGKNQNRLSYPDDGNQICFQLEDESYWFNHRNNVISWAVKKYFKGKIFFDVGGGNGFVSSRLQKEGLEPVLIEPGIVGCLNAKKRGLTNIVNATLQDMNLPDTTVPAMGFFDVIEHLADDKEMLEFAYKCLEKDGLIFISVPAMQWLWSHEDDDAGHYRRYSCKSINDLLLESGFKPLFATNLFSILKWPVFLMRTIPTKLGIKKLLEAKNEHSNNNGIITNFIKMALTNELKTLRKGQIIKKGTSCFIVAQKR